MDARDLFPSAPSAWERTTLGEICRRGGGSIQTGPFGSQLHASDYVLVGVPSIMPVNIGDNRIVPEGIARIRESDAERLSKHRVRPGDVIYSRRGDVERRALIREREDGWLCGTGCLKVGFGDGVINSPFASFYLGHPEIRAWIVRHAVGATMPNLNTAIMEAVPFLLPPIEQQDRIADILGALDDKIELNRRMNETLEAMARRLFKSWFVDFDPVHAKATLRREHPKLSNADLSRRALPNMAPQIAELFPDEFKNSTLGSIPKRWTAGTIGDISVNRRHGVKPQEIATNTPYIGLEHMPRRSIALSEWGKADELASGKFEFTTGAILFGKLRPYFHKVGIAAIDGVCSTDVLVIEPKLDAMLAPLLGHVSSDEMIAHTDTSSTGTRMPRTNWADIARFQLVIPENEIASVASSLTSDFVARIHTNIVETRCLTNTRDKLLPRLLSGELSVDGLNSV